MKYVAHSYGSIRTYIAELSPLFLRFGFIKLSNELPSVIPYFHILVMLVLKSLINFLSNHFALETLTNASNSSGICYSYSLSCWCCWLAAAAAAAALYSAS